MDLSQLKTPFPPQDIEWRAGATNNKENPTRAMALAYITSRAVMDRLDDVCGPEGWRDQYIAGPNGGVLCGLSLRLGDEWVTKWDGADNTQHEAVKGGLSDAFKRAGVKWGIGRYLYNLPTPWVPCEKRGKSVILKETPQLPSWAMPGGESSDGPDVVLEVPPEATEQPESSGSGKGRPLAPADLQHYLQLKAQKYDAYERTASDKQRGLVVGLLSTTYNGDEDHRHTALRYVFGEPSTKELSAGAILALIDWLDPEQTDSGYVPAGVAVTEAQGLVTAALADEGQESLL